MTTITLPDDLAQRLADAARIQGLTPEQLALDQLRHAFPETSTPPAEGSLYDFLKPFIGRIASGSETSLSQDCGERFTDGLVEKHQRGEL